MDKLIFLILCIVLVSILILYFFVIKHKNLEKFNPDASGEIAFVPPPLSSTTNIEQMKELMRIGSQSVENAKYDNVTTPTLL